MQPRKRAVTYMRWQIAGPFCEALSSYSRLHAGSVAPHAVALNHPSCLSRAVACLFPDCS